MHFGFGRPKTIIFYLDRLTNYTSSGKPRCSVYIYLGQAKKKLAKTHIASDYVWDTELQVTLPPDVTDDTFITLRVMDNKREVGNTSIQLFHLPYDTPKRTGSEAFPSTPHHLDPAPKRGQRTATPTGVFPGVLLYSAWIRDVGGEAGGGGGGGGGGGETKAKSTAWRPFHKLRKALSKSNLSGKDSGDGGLKKKKFAKSMFDISAPTDFEELGVNGMTYQHVNLDEYCPPPASHSLRAATSLHDLAMRTDERSTADELLAWVHESVPCPRGDADDDAAQPTIRDVEPREIVWGEENVLSIFGHHLGNAGRDIERLLVCGLDATDGCYSDPPSTEIPYDHIMCHVHGDEDGGAMPKPGEALHRGHVEIFYKDGRHVRSVQRVTVLPPTAEDFSASATSACLSGKLAAAAAAAAAASASSTAPVPTGSPATEQGFEDSDLDTGSDGGQPFDLDNFHPRSGVLEATRAMVASGKFETERRWDENVGSHVMVKPRVSSFSGEVGEGRISHTKNSSMPHLGPEHSPEELEEELEEEEEVQRRPKGPSDRRLSHSKVRSSSDKGSRGFSFPRFLSRSRLDLAAASAAEDAKDSPKRGKTTSGGSEEAEEEEEPSMTDSAYDTLQKLFRRRGWRHPKSQSRSSSTTSADLLEENRRLRVEKQNLKEDIDELWATNQDQRRQINNLQRKLHELTSAFERHKSEADSHRHELSTLKTRLLVDQMHHYLCIDA